MSDTIYTSTRYSPLPPTLRWLTVPSRALNLLTTRGHQLALAIHVPLEGGRDSQTTIDN
jgi:hypothetical protein